MIRISILEIPFCKKSSCIYSKYDAIMTNSSSQEVCKNHIIIIKSADDIEVVRRITQCLHVQIK